MVPGLRRTELFSYSPICLHGVQRQSVPFTCLQHAGYRHRRHWRQWCLNYSQRVLSTSASSSNIVCILNLIDCAFSNWRESNFHLMSLYSSASLAAILTLKLTRLHELRLTAGLPGNCDSIPSRSKKFYPTPKHPIQWYCG